MGLQFGFLNHFGNSISMGAWTCKALLNSRKESNGLLGLLDSQGRFSKNWTNNVLNRFALFARVMKCLEVGDLSGCKTYRSINFIFICIIFLDILYLLISNLYVFVLCLFDVFSVINADLFEWNYLFYQKKKRTLNETGNRKNR